MRKAAWMSMLATLGCAGEPQTATTLSGVLVHDRAGLEASRFYIDAAASDAPVLPSEVADPDGAIPVKLLVGEDVVAAFAERPGTPAERLLGAWPAEAAAGGEMAPGAPVESRPGVTTGPDQSPVPGEEATDDDDHASISGRFTFSAAAAQNVRIDWSDYTDLDDEDLDNLVAIHPGCL